MTEEEKKQRKREAQKRYREKHKEYYDNYNKQYYSNNKEKILSEKQKYYEENKDDILKNKKEYDEKHKKQKTEYNKQYYEDNKEKIREQQKEYKENNKETIKQKQSDYYNTQYGRAIGLLYSYIHNDKIHNRGECTLTAKWIVDNIFSGQKCVYCDETDWHKLGCDRIDNTLPHTPDNVVCSCWEHNRQRKDMDIEEFKKMLGENNS